MPTTLTAVNFVFVTARGGLDETFAEEVRSVQKFLVQHEADSAKKAALFIDDQVPGSGNDAVAKRRLVCVGMCVDPKYFVALRTPFREHALCGQQAHSVREMLRKPDHERALLDNRTAMLGHMAAKTLDGASYIGLLEVVDTRLDVAIWVALPGDKKDFLTMHDLNEEQDTW
ncbi:hypothetical protein [Streptomyces sp. NPDC046860]|uniref:hypothetical protein n=1 Tax=Streptomyces sp. NPDC046860 TaxID=3154495 RepID=UPI0033E24B6D